MSLRLSDAEAKILEGFGIARDKGDAKIDEIAAKYPDVAQRMEAFRAWVHEVTDGQLESLPQTISGYLLDIWTGRAGKDPKAWQGNV